MCLASLRQLNCTGTSIHLSRRMILTTFNVLTPCYHGDCAGFNTRSREGLGTRRPALSRVPSPG